MSLLGSNWKSLIASNKVAVNVRKRKATSDEVDTTEGDLSSSSAAAAASSSSAPASATPCIAIDCEFVGIGKDGAEDALARVSIVNFHGAVLLDRYVKVHDVTDYRTSISGIRPHHLHSKTAVTFKAVQKEVSDLIEGKILVGHAIHNDLNKLMLSHPKYLIRDTQKYKGLCPDRPRSLKNLVAEVLHKTIQQGEHNSIEDARMTLALYKHVRTEWEKKIWEKQNGKKVISHVSSSSSSNAMAVDVSDEHDDTPIAAKSSSSSSSSSSTTKKSHRSVDPLEAKQEARAQAKVERNQRRAQTRKKQKLEKQNR